MEVDAVTRNKIKEVVFSSTEPPSTNVLWGKPTGDKVSMYIFKNGSWVNIKDKEIDPIVKAYVDEQYAAIQEELKKDRKHVSDIAEDKDYKYTVITKKIDTINTNISTLDTTTTKAIENVNTKISSESTRAVNAEQSLDTKITNETSRAQEAENTLQDNITTNATAITTLGNTKQDTLVSGTNIKTVNNESILGEGNIKTAPDIWANVLSVEDTAILVDGKKVELPANKNVIIKDFRSVKACKKEDFVNYPLLCLALFDIHYNGKLVPMDEFDISESTYASMGNRGYSLLHSLDVSGFDTTNMTSLYCTFRSIDKIPYFDVSGWNTSNVTTICGIFCNNGVKSLNLKGWDTSKVTKMTSAFLNCPNLTTIVQNFNTSNVSYLNNMFNGDTKLTYVDVSNWDVRNVYDFSAMFLSCSSLTKLDTSNWVTSKGRDFSQLFKGCGNLKALDVSKFDLTYDTGSYAIFSGCSYLSDITFGKGWGRCNKKDIILDLSNVATKVNYKFTDNTYNSMLDMLDRVAESLITTFIIRFSSKHNIPDGWVDKMTARGYTISIV